MFRSAFILFTIFIASTACGNTKGPSDILDPKYDYDISGSVPKCLLRIENILKSGVRNIDDHANDIAAQIASLEKKQETSWELSRDNQYSIRFVKAEQNILDKRLGIIEEQGINQRKINALLIKGVQDSTALLEARKDEQVIQNQFLEKKVKDSLKTEGKAWLGSIFIAIVSTIVVSIFAKMFIKKMNIRFDWGQKESTSRDTKMRD